MGALVTGPIARAVELTTEEELKQVVERLSPDNVARLRDAIRKCSSSGSASNGIFRSPYGDLSLPKKTIPQEVLSKCDAFGDKVAMINGPTGEQWTFQKLAADTRAFAGGLAKPVGEGGPGLKAGDIVAVLLPNMPEYFVILHGVFLLGAVATTLNPLYGSAELQHCLGLTQPKMVVTCDALFPGVKTTADEIKLDVQFVIVESKDKWENVAQAELKKPAKTFSEMLSPGAPFEENADPEALAVLPYSSGTTGMPKAVMLTHRNIVSNVYQVGSHYEILQLTPEDTLLAVLPFFHIYGMLVIMELSIWSGSKTVVIPKFIPDLYLKMLKEHEVTIAHVAPPLVNFLAKHPSVDSVLPLPKLKQILCGAAPLSGDLAQAAIDRLNLQVLRQGYGMTEMSPASHIGPRTNFKGGSIGFVVPNMEMKLVSPADGKTVTGKNQDGEIWMRGPNIMKGYYKNTEATKECIDEDGFFKTGDVAQFGEDNHLWVVDRIKELIKVKGFQVAPAELEGILVKHPKIMDAAVIGVAAGHKYGGKEGDGQLPKAFIVKKEESLTEDDVKDFVKSELSTVYKHLGAVQFIDAIPKNPSGKILRKDLRKMEEDAGGKIFA